MFRDSEFCKMTQSEFDVIDKYASTSILWPRFSDASSFENTIEQLKYPHPEQNH